MPEVKEKLNLYQKLAKLRKAVELRSLSERSAPCEDRCHGLLVVDAALEGGAHRINPLHKRREQEHQPQGPEHAADARTVGQQAQEQQARMKEAQEKGERPQFNREEMQKQQAEPTQPTEEGQA